MSELSDRGFLFTNWRLVVVQDVWASDFVRVLQNLRGVERIGYRNIGSCVVWKNVLDQIID